jgi:hypothetical protein
MNLHKFTSILSGALLLISLNLHAKEVKNFYINGINNTEEEAESSAKAIKDAFTEKYGHILKNTEVVSIYNESQGTFLDLIESGMQETNLDKFLEGLTGLQILTASKAAEISQKISDNASEGAYMKLLEINDLLIDNRSLFESSDPFAEIVVEDSIGYIETSQIIQPLTGPGSTSQGSENTLNEIHSVNKLARLLDLGMTATELASLKAISNASGLFRDIALAKKEFRENYGYYASQEYLTQQKIRTKLDEVLDIGGAVNIVAHSQGNYFANEAVNNINQPNNTRLLSVGSPLGFVQETGAFVNLREDLVVRSFNHVTGWNYSNIPDSRWDTLLNNGLPGELAINVSNIGFANTEFNYDAKGHNFITAYLQPESDTREVIIDTMAKHYVEMGGELIKPIGDIDAQLQCDAFEKVYSVNSVINYDVEFYGDRCLFFAEDHVVDYNIEDELVNQIYYAIDNLDTYVEYTTYRNFLNNLQLAKADETWRNNFGLTLNSYGNIGCVIGDICFSNNPPAFSYSQCPNIFKAVTGLYPGDISYDATHKSYSEICFFISNINQKIIEYNYQKGTVEVKTFFDYPIENILDSRNYDASLSLFNYMTHYANIEDVLECRFGRVETYKFGIYSENIGVLGNGSECVLSSSFGLVNFIYDRTLEKYMFSTYEDIPSEL